VPDAVPRCVEQDRRRLRRHPARLALNARATARLCFNFAGVSRANTHARGTGK
jgi:hypothetical protein